MLILYYRPASNMPRNTLLEEYEEEVCGVFSFSLGQDGWVKDLLGCVWLSMIPALRNNGALHAAVSVADRTDFALRDDLTIKK